VVGTGGDTFLGGVDFDDRLMQFVLQSFVEETDIDVSYDRTAVRRIRDAAEQAKITLSTKRKARVYLPAITTEDEEVVDLDMVVTREQLEDLTRDLVDRSLRICREILTEASSNSDRKLDDLLVVGGQSRMPLVRRALTKFLGRKPMAKIDPEEAIALGAAIMAHSLSAAVSDDEKVTLLDVLPMAIGIAKPNGLMHPLFKRNHTLPCSKSLMLTTHEDGQRSIILRLYQGDASKASANASLGTFVFSGLRNAPKGGVRVEITLHIDSEGIVNLSARDTDTDQSVESRLKLGGPKRTESKKRKRKAVAPEAIEEPAVKKKPTRKKRKPKKRTSKAAAERKRKAAAPDSTDPTEKKRTSKKKPVRKKRKPASTTKASGKPRKASGKPRKPRKKQSSADAVPRPTSAPVQRSDGWWKKLKQRWRGDSD
jgi:molecular chaperone DnaK